MSWPPVRLLLTGWTVTILCYFSVGYQYSVMNVAHDVFLEFINNSYVSHYDSTPSTPFLHMLWSITVSLWQAGAMVGSLMSCLVEERFGRKVTLLVIAGVLQILGSLMMASAPVIDMFELLAAGRFVSGISSGLICPTLRVFLCEISPDKYRGVMNSFGGLVLAVAAVMAMALGQSSVLGSMNMLPYLLGLCVVPSLLQFILNPFIPQSPKYLYIHERNHVAAVRSIFYYYGDDTNVASAFKEFEQEKRLADSEISFFRALRSRAVFMPLALSYLLGLAHSSIGVDIIDSYSTEIFVEYGMSEEIGKKSSILFNVPGLIGSIVATMYLVNKVGRRPLMLSTLFLCALCNLSFVGLGVYSQHVGYNKWIGIGAVFLSCFLAFVYGLGPGAVAEFLFAEISPQNVRSVAGSVSEFSFWSSNVIYVLLFPPLMKIIGPYVFLIYTIPLLICAIIFCFKLPETADLSVMQIAADMASDHHEPSSSNTGTAEHRPLLGEVPTDDHKSLVGNMSRQVASYGSFNEYD